MERIHQITNSTFPTTNHQSSAPDSTMFQMFFQQFQSASDEDVQSEETTVEHSELEQSMDEDTFSKANISKQEHSSQASSIPISTFATQSSQQSASTTNETSNMQQTTTRMDTEFLVGMEQKNSHAVFMQTNSPSTDVLGKSNEHRTTNLFKESVESYSNRVSENKMFAIQTVPSVNENPEVMTNEALPSPFSVEVTSDSSEKINSLPVNRSMEVNTVIEEQQFNPPLVNPTGDLLETVPDTKEMLTEAFQVTKEHLPTAQSFIENQLHQNSEILIGEFSQIEKDTLPQTSPETTGEESSSVATMDSASPDISWTNPLNSTSDNFMGETKQVEKNIEEQPLKNGVGIELSAELPTAELPTVASMVSERLRPTSDKFLGMDHQGEENLPEQLNAELPIAASIVPERLRSTSDKFLGMDHQGEENLPEQLNAELPIAASMVPERLRPTSDKFLGMDHQGEENLLEQSNPELSIHGSLFPNRLKSMSDQFLGPVTIEESIVTQPINSGELEATAELLTSVAKTKQTVPSSEVILDESSVIEKLSEQQTLNTDLENGIDEAVVLKNRTIDPEVDLPKGTQAVNETLPNKSSDTLVEKVLSSKVLSKEVAPTEIVQAPIIEKIVGSDKQQVPTVIEEVPETAKKTAAILDKSIPVDQEISEPKATNRVEVQSEKQSLPVENENVESTDQVHSTTKTESTDKSITPKSVGNSEIVTSSPTTIPVREAGTIALDVPKIQSGHGPTFEKVVQEIAKPIQQELQTMVRPNEKVVTFDLDPGDLGKIQVKMKVTAQSVSLELTVQSEQTKKMFEAITTRLDKVLQKQENVSVFTVTRSEPTIASTTDNQNSLSQSFQQGFSQERPMQQQRHPAGRYRKQQLEENVVEHEVESRVSILA
ncbi:hypothetical protein DOK78_000914 [Enterococcus sp. DIV2402]|uniref:Flagellar hook-length control protein-like C-terminal domain-containing protein n=1 Tax=Candidatus Enterococcus lowellii TaxID=2230877 RepID=A0ABZ2SKA6_9ENTE|nr:flagellar hook-length control protein FliK [Enterococcus sp. DIV2402]MBO0465753.1 flagellar hook-length control protein FliK [Enterococcus sp. DIV2402]